MRKLIAGNWKMNGLSADLGAIEAIASAVAGHSGVDTALCLPATLVGPAATRLPGYAIGGQDCHMAVSGAHTGCVSAAMLADAGAKLTIVGHSERRAAQGESDADVRGKASAARAAGLNAIVCVGETEAERDAGQAESVVLGQLQGSLPDDANGSWLSVAYEPVWAIGTGRVPSVDDVSAMHRSIRERLVAIYGEAGAVIRILYGGSVNAANAAELLGADEVGGALVGGASLTAESFLAIVLAATPQDGA